MIFKKIYKKSSRQIHCTEFFKIQLKSHYCIQDFIDKWQGYEKIKLNEKCNS